MSDAEEAIGVPIVRARRLRAAGCGWHGDHQQVQGGQGGILLILGVVVSVGPARAERDCRSGHAWYRGGRLGRIAESHLDRMEAVGVARWVLDIEALDERDRLADR